MKIRADRLENFKSQQESELWIAIAGRLVDMNDREEQAAILVETISWQGSDDAFARMKAPNSTRNHSSCSATYPDIGIL